MDADSADRPDLERLVHHPGHRRHHDLERRALERLESIGLWHLPVVIAAFNHRADFTNGLGNWYVISVIAVLVGMLVLYAAMEGQRRGSRIALAGN